MSARLLVRALADPTSVAALDGAGWTALLTVARAESLGGALAARMAGQPMPRAAARVLADLAEAARLQQRDALWEAEMAVRALRPAGITPILLKGTAYAAAGLGAAAGRTVGDLDLLVPRDRIDAAEAALLAAGWEPLKNDPYDDAYYRRWMHELPPLIHRDRNRIVDVHHAILPLTARPTPDADSLIDQAVPAGEGLLVLHPADMVVHAAAHLFADGDLAGGLRNLWDIDRLLREFVMRPRRWAELEARARRHGLQAAVGRALRLAELLYGTPVDRRLAGRARSSDRLFVRRLLARDGWGQATRPLTRLAFYVRSHWLRMPPAMLARHLWVKARR